LSGLITPSLDEMVDVAAKMQEAGLKIPLLIGGATTSAIHTAVKIAPGYKGSTVHVIDASKSVPVATKLLSQGNSQAFIEENEAKHAKLLDRHLNKKNKNVFLTLRDARDNEEKVSWDHDVIKPSFLGTKTISNFDLNELVPFIDWTPFFLTWELAGTYPKILKNNVVGEEATKLFADAKDMLQKIVDEKWLTANAVVGFYPANRIKDDLELYEFDKSTFEIDRNKTTNTLHFLRQQKPKQNDRPNYCLADFVATKDSEREDYIGCFAVTTGLGCDEKCKEFEKDHDDYSSIMLKALADRLAEAFAERLHQIVRKEFWGTSPSEDLTNKDLIKEEYKGIRPAPGYPACPEHSEKSTLFQLLDATKNTGIELTDGYAMFPAAAVSGWYFGHPDAHYFAVGEINKDQVTDYSKRKGITFEQSEKLLRPILGYQ